MLFRKSLSVVALVFCLAACSAAADPTVYVTSKSGTKYHKKNCRLKQGSTGIKLSVAKKRGFTPCKVCKPVK
jgi:competence protein ComEC